MQAAGYDWDIEWHWAGDAEVSECIGISLYLYRGHDRGGQRIPLLDAKGKQVVVSYLKSDALRMLTTITDWSSGRGVKKRVSILEKDNWKATPRNLYFARCITNAQRWHAPGVLSVNLPSVEEVLDMPEPEQQEQRPNFRKRGSAEAAENLISSKIQEAAANVPPPSQATEEAFSDEETPQSQQSPSPDSPDSEPKLEAKPEQKGEPKKGRFSL
jgi:hypothetical protein